MDPQARRKKIIEEVQRSNTPVSGAALARLLSVSRQVIVQDMAVIRAEGVDIEATNRGYVIQSEPVVTRIIKCSHTEEQIEDELFTIVDAGANVDNIIVNHRFYNRIEAPLNIKSRRDAKEYIEAIISGKSKSLSSATSGYHYHTISAENEDILDEIEQELKVKGVLLPLDDWIFGGDDGRN